jgi:hypothetical protein
LLGTRCPPVECGGMSWQPTGFKVYRYSLRGVEHAIAAGCEAVFEDAIPTQYDRFFTVVEEMGLLPAFQQLTDLRRDPDVPVTALCILMMVRFLRALPSFKEMGKLLLRYRPLLERLGFSVEVCEKGVRLCKRTRNRDKREAQKVFDEEVFSEVLRDLDREELHGLMTGFVKVLRKKYPSLFEQGLFAMDSNCYRVVGLPVGQKWCAVMLLTRYGLIPVAIEFSATAGEGSGETSIGRKVLERVVRTYGQGFLKIVLMDAGYIDGETLHWLKKKQGADWVIRTKEDMRASQYMAGEAAKATRFRWREVKAPQLGWPKAELPTRHILWVEDIPSIGGRTGKLNGCVIRDTYPPSARHPEGKVQYQYLAASNREWKGWEIHAYWRFRWSIENAFGYMTDEWGLGKWENRNLAVYQATIQFMVLTYGMHVLVQLLERKGHTLGELKQRFEWQSHNMVLIRAGDACAILTPKTLNGWMARGILTIRAP